MTTKLKGDLRKKGALAKAHKNSLDEKIASNIKKNIISLWKLGNFYEKV